MNRRHDDNGTRELGRLLKTLEQLLAIQATALKPALTAASTLIAAAINADKTDVFLYEHTSHTLVAVGTSTTPMGQQQIALGLDRLQLANGGRSVEVFQTGQVYRHGQVDTDIGELRGIREGLGVRSVVIVPLTVNGQRRGVIQADSAQPDAFNQEDVSFLEAVSHWVGMVIQRGELVEQLTREAAAETRRLVAEELVTILAHDLRNYLTPLVGRVHLMQRRAEREQRQRDIDDTTRMLNSLSDLQHFITDLLDVGRIDQGLFTMERQPVNLADLARELAEALHTPDFEVAVEAPDELVALVDPARIRQALHNLLANAQRHAPGSPVLLRVGSEQRKKRPWAILSVQDQGPGVPAAVLPRLTERFVRGHHSMGLGMGLYLARNIAQAHGGTLEVTSVEGKGATFHVCIPITT